MNNLKDIHNKIAAGAVVGSVVLSGFQWTIWRIYTTSKCKRVTLSMLFYQDFNEQFEGYTQHSRLNTLQNVSCFIRISMNNLKDIHNGSAVRHSPWRVVLSGFQWTIWRIYTTSQNALHINAELFYQDFNEQFWRIYTTGEALHRYHAVLFNKDFNEQFCCKSTEKMGNMQIYKKLFWYFRKKHYLCSNKFEGYTQ